MGVRKHLATHRTGRSPAVWLTIAERRLEDAGSARSATSLLVAVSDRAIAEVRRAIPETNAIIFHPSGALPALRGGFSLHPLKSLPPVGEPSDLEGTLLVFEGDHRDDRRGRSRRAAGARFAEIARGRKDRAITPARYLDRTTSRPCSTSPKSLIGIDGAREDIAALARSAIDNWAAHTDAAAFHRTGGARRRGSHRNGIWTRLRDPPELAEIYRLLAARILAAAK